MAKGSEAIALLVDGRPESDSISVLRRLTITSGVGAASTHFLETAPASASTAVTFALSGRNRFIGTADVQGAGHAGAVIGELFIEAPGRTIGLAIGGEFKVQNNAGHIINAVSAENLCAANAAGQQIDQWIGSHNNIDANAGTVVLASGSRSRINNNLGVVSELRAFEVGPNTGIAPVVAVGLFIPETANFNGSSVTVGVWSKVAASGGGTRRGIVSEGDAANVLIGETRCGADVSMGALLGSNDYLALKIGTAAPGANASFARVGIGVDGHFRVYGPSGSLDLGLVPGAA